MATLPYTRWGSVYQGNMPALSIRILTVHIPIREDALRTPQAVHEWVAWTVDPLPDMPVNSWIGPTIRFHGDLLIAYGTTKEGAIEAIRKRIDEHLKALHSKGVHALEMQTLKFET